MLGTGTPRAQPGLGGVLGSSSTSRVWGPTAWVPPFFSRLPEMGQSRMQGELGAGLGCVLGFLLLGHDMVYVWDKTLMGQPWGDRMQAGECSWGTEVGVTGQVLAPKSPGGCCALLLPSMLVATLVFSF